jgi:hypothetical protein
VLDFVDPAWDIDTRNRVIAYLNGGFCLAATTRWPCIFEGHGCLDDSGDSRSLCARTDGVWSWADNLTHYVEHHQVRVPDSFVRHMEAMRFTPPGEITPPGGDWLAYGRTLAHPPLLNSRDSTPHVLFPRPPKPDAGAVRQEASAAFRARDFHRAAELYQKIKPLLSPAERRKLEYAKEQVAADDGRGNR